jgi:type II secretory pathway predicted ATPase ExeA
MSVQDVRLISLTPLAGSRGRVATALARAIGDNDLLIMLSGPEGSGKSAILAAVVATLAYGGMRVIRVSNPDNSTMGQRELAARILGRPTMGSPAQLVAEAITNLLASTDDGQVVLVVDDAHTLSDQALELLLVITSPARRGVRAPQLLLAGRGAYWERPWRDELRMLTDVAEKIILEPLTSDDARDFVMDEAKASGGTITDVTSDALTALVRCSSGLSTQMDRIVTAAVALGNSRRATVLTEELIDAVVTPDTLLQPPCVGASILGGDDGTATSPAIEPPGQPVQRKFPGGWPAIAATALAVVAGASVGLVPPLRTQVASLFEQSAPVLQAPAPAPTSEATTAPEAPKVAQDEQTRQANDTGVATGRATASATPDTASPPVNGPPNAAVSPPAPSIGAPPSVATISEPPAAAREPDHPPAKAEHPVISAPQRAVSSDPAAEAASPTEASHGEDQQTAARSTASGSATDIRAASPARGPDATKPETPEVLPTPAPVVAMTPSPTPPAANPTAAPPPIAPLPAAPPPVAALPDVPPPAPPPPAVAPTPAAPPPSAAAPKNPASLPPSAIAMLLQRGNEKLAAGDVLSARLYFERAGDAGSEVGAMAAGRTYDPGYLATIDAPGLQANARRAIEWYRIAAAAHDNPEAQRRIDALTASGAR